MNVLSFGGQGSRVLKCVCKRQCKNNKCKCKALQVNFVTQNVTIVFHAIINNLYNNITQNNLTLK